MQTPFARHFSLRGPIVLAPLAGGPCTPQFVAHACEGGALGSVAGAYLQPEELESFCRQVRELTAKPFALNLFVPDEVRPLSDEQVRQALQALSPFHQRLNLKPPLAPIAPYLPDFSAQFEAMLEIRPAAFSFTFGILDAELMKECQAQGVYTIGTATSLQEGLQLAEAGVQAIVAQGFEAGGHRGFFDPNQDDPGRDTLTLTALLHQALRLPIISAGGVMNGRDICSALEAGAEAAQLGTAFLCCDEAGTSPPYRAALQNTSGRQTQLTRVFSGRLARGLENNFMAKLDPQGILPFPQQNKLTQFLRKESERQNNPEFLSLWAGKGFRAIRPMPVARLIKTLLQELEEARQARE